MATMVMLLSIPLTSCINPHCILLLKEMRYRQLFIIGIPRSVIRYGGAPIVAIWFPSYWALVTTYVLSFLAEAILSYFVIKNRARILWNRSQFLEMYSFSGWLQINGILKWMSRYLDSFVVGNTMGTNALGLYNRAFTLASLPSQQINMILVKVGFPLFAAIQSEKSKTNQAALHLLNLATVTFFPVMLLILLFGPEIVRLVLGVEWISLVPALQILVCAMYLRSLADILLIVLRSHGHSRLEFTNNLVRIIATGAALYPLSRTYGMTGAASAVLIGSICGLPSVLYWSARVLDLAWQRVAESIGVVALAGGLLVWLFHTSNPWIAGHHERFAVAVCAALALGFSVLAGFHFFFGIGPFKSVETAYAAVRRNMKMRSANPDAVR
jgi:O-antigen/teichoic acid export membrane protein